MAACDGVLAGHAAVSVSCTSSQRVLKIDNGHCRGHNRRVAGTHKMRWPTRVALAFGLACVLYLVSFFPACSIAFRTRSSWPMAWSVYSPIPFACQQSMLRFWMKVDPHVRAKVGREIFQRLAAADKAY